MIDLAATRKAAEGDPGAKVAVSKRWLKAVADEIETLRKNQKAPASRDDPVEVFFRAMGYGNTKGK
jgi:hypothetical protein